MIQDSQQKLVPCFLRVPSDFGGIHIVPVYRSQDSSEEYIEGSPIDEASGFLIWNFLVQKWEPIAETFDKLFYYRSVNEYQPQSLYQFQLHENFRGLSDWWDYMDRYSRFHNAA